MGFNFINYEITSNFWQAYRIIGHFKSDEGKIINENSSVTNYQNM